MLLQDVEYLVGGLVISMAGGAAFAARRGSRQGA
jgi:hypothetical protein